MMNPLPDLSVILIVRNEERDVAACLESVRDLSKDIVVVDSGSTDRTLDIARAYTDRIFYHEWKGYGLQKQYALEQAKGPWVLNIDADERVTGELAGSIRAALTSEPSPQVNGYDISFRHFFRGRRLRFGGCGGEHHIRLFRKDKARYGDRPIHEGIFVAAPIATLAGAIDHVSYRDLADYLEKCNRYTTLIAEKKAREGARFHVWNHLRLPFEFVLRYGVKGGFLDGEPGFTYALLSSYYVWLKYAKLKDMGVPS